MTRRPDSQLFEDVVQLLLHRVEHFAHLLVYKVDRLKRSYENAELNDFAVVVARDHVDPIDIFAFDRGLKFEYGMVTIENLFGVTKSLR